MRVRRCARRIAGKVRRQRVTPRDLLRAEATLRSRFVVGLTDRMEESARRFNAVLGESRHVRKKRRGRGARTRFSLPAAPIVANPLGIDDARGLPAECMRSFFGGSARRFNANAHPEVRAPAHRRPPPAEGRGGRPLRRATLTPRPPSPLPPAGRPESPGPAPPRRDPLLRRPAVRARPRAV